MPTERCAGIGLNYQSIGSGGGIKQIKAKTVTFGASDMPLKPDELKASGLVQFPMIIGGVVPVVNVKGVRPGQLMLDGATLAAIYLGDITTWNDARSSSLNPEAGAARHGHRAGVPFGRFGHELPVLRLSVQGEPEVQGQRSARLPRCSGRSGIGAKGNEGVANMTTQTDGAIGYVEFAYAKQNKMAYALADQQGRQGRGAECRHRSRRRPPMRTGRTRMATI